MSKSATAKTNVVLVDAVRTPFGKAGSLYAGTRADDIMVRCIRGLLERNPNLPVDQIDDVAIAAATQTGDQGMNIGRSVSILAGIPKSVPGYSIDGTLLAGTVGFDVNTSWVQLVLWATYLGLVLRLYTRPSRTAQTLLTK